MEKILLSLVIVGSLLAAGCPPKTPDTIPDKIMKSEGWVLKIWVTQKGTRSEGHYALLSRQGQTVCPDGNHTTIETPLGKLEYRENPYPWSWHGWKPLQTPPDKQNNFRSKP